MSDDSLDDELLAAVGRSSHGGGSSKKPMLSSQLKRNRDDWSSEDEDDEPSELKSKIEGDDGDSEGTGLRSKTNAKMPLKKRLEKNEEEEEAPVHGDGYDTDVSYDSDLYIDDEDRERLSKMTELDREWILTERGERRESHLARNAARQKKDVNSGGFTGRQKDYERTPALSSRIRASTRDSRSANKSALDKLVSARRQKAHDSDQRRSREFSPPRRKTRDELGYVSSDSSDDEQSPQNNISSQLEKQDEDEDAKLSFEDIANITIRRSKLVKWFLEPFFEDIIAGCFVRVGVGIKDSHSCYRLCQVKNVDAGDPSKQYNFENRTTHKWLNLVWGDSEARWQMARISNQPLTNTEFEQWQEEVQKTGIQRPSMSDLIDKKEAISNLSTFVYSADLVKKMLHEKKMAAFRPFNVAAEKDCLLKELALAQSKDDQVKVEEIQAKVKELEAYSMQSQTKNTKAMALAQMNKRNRFENFKNASELKPVSAAKAGEAGYDPFSRRWTRSQNYYDRSSRAANTENLKASEVVTAAAQEAAADAGKLTDTRAPVEDNKVFLLHDFDLPISLSGIQKFGGAQGAHLAFIARKQRLEATCGVSVENLDGKRHMLTLTVNDYKRRRGLL